MLNLRSCGRRKQNGLVGLKIDPWQLGFGL